jgi:hypothetical protein
MKRSLQSPTDSREDGLRRRYSLTMNGTPRNGSPSGPSKSGLEPNAEDIEGVLGRFQVWEKTRRDQPNSKNGSTARIGRGAASRKANLGGGVRELTYEQALRASSYRRPAYPEAAEMSARALKPEAIASPQAELPEVDPATSLHYATEGTAKSAPAPRTIAIADSGTARATRSSAPRAEMHTAAASIPRVSGVVPKSQVRSGNGSRTLGGSLDPAVSVVPPLPEVTRLQAPTPAGKPQHIEPAFREVLKGTAGLAATASAVPDAKSIALSLRVSNAEQARIRACAARANLSVSAYLRQCALGVDDLRDQVELALGELHKRDAKPAMPPGLSALPGILGRFTTHWFRRLRLHHDYTAISLR